MATQQPITRICSPGVVDRVYLQSGVVELVRSNLAPDFPLFHDFSPFSTRSTQPAKLS